MLLHVIKKVVTFIGTQCSNNGQLIGNDMRTVE